MKLDLKDISNGLGLMVKSSIQKLTDNSATIDPQAEQDVELRYRYFIVDVSEFGLEPLEEELGVDAGLILSAVLTMMFYEDTWEFDQICLNDLRTTPLDNVDARVAKLKDWCMTHAAALVNEFGFVQYMVPAKITEVQFAHGFALVEVCNEVEDIDLADFEEKDDEDTEEESLEE